MRTADFDYELPPELIAQTPAPRRDQSRLLVLQRSSGRIEHRQFRNLPEFLRAGDVLVLNDSRVIPARLRGSNARSGGKFEVLLLEENGLNDWWVMLRPGKRARVGTRIILRDLNGRPAGVQATVIETNEEGHRRLRFECFQVAQASPPASAAAVPAVVLPDADPNILDHLDRLGEAPLPPYINRPDTHRMEEDRERYQTVFARPPGSVAAPTAGLHFTESLLDELRARGVEVCFVTLHVGLGTFAPVKSESIAGHVMHEERYELSEETARVINEAKSAGRRVIAVGTTTVRVLESVAAQSAERGCPSRSSYRDRLMGEHPERPRAIEPAAAGTAALREGSGKTRIFIYPPYDFKIVDALLTNFHLPRSTLLMLVSAFAAPNGTRGRELVLSAYAEAIRERYRFFSYGDAMLVV